MPRRACARPSRRRAATLPARPLPGGRAIKAAKIRGIGLRGHALLRAGAGHRPRTASGILELPAGRAARRRLSTVPGPRRRRSSRSRSRRTAPTRSSSSAWRARSRRSPARPSASRRSRCKEGEAEAAALATRRDRRRPTSARATPRASSPASRSGPRRRGSPSGSRAVGLRPINNLVDVTNYVLWELGQPLHAFDYDTRGRATRSWCGGRGRASGSRTLDGQERALEPDMLMICDPERAVAVGGVMGGGQHRGDGGHDDGAARERVLQPRLASAGRRARSGCTPTPRTASSAAPTSKGSARPSTAPPSSWPISAAARSRKGVLDVYPGPQPAPAHRAAPLAHRAAHRRLPAPRGGREDPPGAGLRRGRLGASTLEVVVPSFRRDIAQEDDLVEEIIRVWGYDKIPSTLVEGRRAPARHAPAPISRVARAVTARADRGGALPGRHVRLRRSRAPRGDGLERARGPDRAAEPDLRERSVLRPSLAPGLLDVVALNGSRQIPTCASSRSARPSPRVATRTAIAPPTRSCGLARGDDGAARGRAPGTPARERVDVYDAKGAAELVLGAAAGGRGGGRRRVPRRQGAALSRGGPRRRAHRRRPRRWAGSARSRSTCARRSICRRRVFLAELSLTALLRAAAPRDPRTSRCRAFRPSSGTSPSSCRPR